MPVNYLYILSIVGFLAIGIGVFIAVTRSFKLLKTDIQPYYSFDLSLKGSGGWSLLFFFAMIAILGLAFLLFSQANLALTPA